MEGEGDPMRVMRITVALAMITLLGQVLSMQLPLAE
jgi:hypothetical protein